MSKTPDTPTDAPKPRKRGRWLLILLVLAVLGAGGGGGYWWWARQHALSAQTADGHGAAGAHSAPETETGSLLALESFTVNLADPGASRFLRANVQLVLEGEETATELEHNALAVMRARSTILELLTTQTSATLTTAEGKAALKKAIAERVTGVLRHKVTDVLFSDFVVQF